MNPIDLTEEDDIRPPDKVRRERLLDDPRPQDEQDMDEAIYQSIQDLEAINAEQKMLEQQLHESFMLKQQEREKEIKPILNTLIRLAPLDTKTAELLELLSPILYSYSEGLINFFCCSEEVYNTVFNNIRKIRLRPEDHEVLHRVIVLPG
jgi:hypothetical protein